MHAAVIVIEQYDCMIISVMTLVGVEVGPWHASEKCERREI